MTTTRAGLALALLLGAPAAGAVITTVNGSGAYSITLRVGAAAGVDMVSFAVANNTAGLNPAPTAGTPSIDVWVQPVRPAPFFGIGKGSARPVTLLVDSSAKLACIDKACGNTQIPFTTIGWTATNVEAAGKGDIRATGTFDGTAQQAITDPAAGFDANATTCPFLGFGFCATASRNITATRMNFVYDNKTVYPAGVYTGTVRFTATMQ